MQIKIRENIPEYMSELKKWINETKDIAPEDMVEFFSARMNGYEEHMLQWERAYERFAELFRDLCQKRSSGGAFLDLGCGTGLELDFIFRYFPKLNVVGIDLNREMLDRMLERHHGRNIRVLCEDYFRAELPKVSGVISFESLHHFPTGHKLELYKKVYCSIKEDGFFLLGDYIACCPEEEKQLCEYAKYKRSKFLIPDEQFIHIDTPLCYDKEVELFRLSGFGKVEICESIDGVTIICGEK